MNISIITQYSFIVVAIGTMLLAMATGIVGTISILKGQSLIGDAVGHASLPGIILAFMISGRKSSLILMIGAIAVILSAMFGMGMVLKSYIQGNPKYQGASQSGLASYIFGQAAYILREDVYIILTVSIISLALFILFYKEIKVYVFDMVYAYTIGINSRLTSLLIMIITMILIAAGLKAVGAILISSMLITPAVTGLQWSNSYEKVLVIAAVTGAVSAFLGTFISSAVKGFSTGPSIILIMSVIALFSVLFAPRGIVRMLLNIRKMRVGK